MIERRVRIVNDSDPCNPRTEYDCHSGRMLCWHSRYDLGDEHSYNSDNWKRELACEADNSLEDYIDRLENDVADKLYERAQQNGCEGWEECSAYAESFIRKRIDKRIDDAFDDGYVALPLYLYDHSGITMNTGGFSCGWDSGCVGVIICDKETIDNDFNGDRDLARKALESEVKVYDQYLTGDVWSFIALEREGDSCSECNRKHGWEVTDSCGGFYGSDPETNGMYDHIDAEYIDSLLDAEPEYL